MECRMKLGILGEERQSEQDALGYDQVDTLQNRDLNLEIARKSLVLLKNENGFLPLDKKNVKAIGVIGPNADSRKALVGNYDFYRWIKRMLRLLVSLDRMRIPERHWWATMKERHPVTLQFWKELKIM